MQTITGHNDHYNGAIQAQSWFSPVDDGTPRTYAYQYDHTNQLATYDAFDNALTSFGAGAGSGSDAVPSAHLNYILFNRDMNLIQHGFIPVTSAARNNTNKEKIEIAPISIAIEGIIYVYVSNTSASNNMVYFDDLSITHHTSPVVFGNDYYPL